MADDNVSTISGIGLSLTLDTAQYDAAIERSERRYKRFLALLGTGSGSTVTTPLRGGAGPAGAHLVPAGASGAPINFYPTFAAGRGAVGQLRSELRRELASTPIPISVTLGRSRFGELRREISNAIGPVPIQVTYGGQRGGTMDVVSSIVARSQGISLVDARRQIRTSMATVGVDPGSLEKRAKGGPVLPGRRYIVGENGPELFTTKLPGRITPADDVRKLRNEYKQLIDLQRAARGIGPAARFPGVEQNLRSVLSRATSEQVKFGLDWYPSEGKRLAQSAAKRGLSSDALAAIVAKFSQNSPWPANLGYAEKFIDQIHAGATPETVKGIFATMAARRDALDVIMGKLRAGDILKGPKETPFAHALLGDPMAVPVDRWMNRAAGHFLTSTGKPMNVAPAGLRDLITESTIGLARERGWAPSGTQAVIWDVVGGGRDPKTGMRRARGGRVGGKYGAAKPGTVKQYIDLQNQLWGENVGDPRFRYHATDNLRGIRGREPELSRPGVQPISNVREQDGSMSLGSFWANRPLPYYGPSLIRTPYSPETFERQGYDIARRPIGRNQLEYWGEDNDWHRFRRGRRRARGGWIESAKDVRIRKNKLGLNAIMQRADLSQRYRGLEPFSAESSWAMDLDAGLIPEPEDLDYFDAMARARGHMATGGAVIKAPRRAGRETAESWLTRTAHRVKPGVASAANGPRGGRMRCHAIVHPDEEWPGNRLCHLPIINTEDGWRHENFDELYKRYNPPPYNVNPRFNPVIAKLQAMADQSVSPNEAEVARRKLRARGVEGYAGGGWAEAYRQTLANRGGTFDPQGRQPKKGYAVELGQGPIVDAGNRRAFARAYRQMLGQAPYVGTWMPEGSDQIWMGATDVVSRKRAAQKLALQQAQIAAFDLKRFEEVFPKWNPRYPSPGQMKLGMATGGPVYEELRRQRQAAALAAREQDLQFGWRSDPQVQKLIAMADQSVSPNEAEIAARMLRQRGVPGYAKGGPARKGGLPRGYSLEFLTPADPEERASNFLGAHDLMDVFGKKIRKATEVGKAVNWAGSYPEMVAAVVRHRGKIVASAPFTVAGSPVGQAGGYLHPEMTKVDPEHEGKGLATAMYVKAERFTGKQVRPAVGDQTLLGSGLWMQKNRPFGKKFDEEVELIRQSLAERIWVNGPVAGYRGSVPHHWSHVDPSLRSDPPLSQLERTDIEANRRRRAQWIRNFGQEPTLRLSSTGRWTSAPVGTVGIGNQPVAFCGQIKPHERHRGCAGVGFAYRRPLFETDDPIPHREGGGRILATNLGGPIPFDSYGYRRRARLLQAARSGRPLGEEFRWNAIKQFGGNVGEIQHEIDFALSRLKREIENPGLGSDERIQTMLAALPKVRQEPGLSSAFQTRRDIAATQPMEKFVSGRGGSTGGPFWPDMHEILKTPELDPRKALGFSRNAAGGRVSPDLRPAHVQAELERLFPNAAGRIGIDRFSNRAQQEIAREAAMLTERFPLTAKTIRAIAFNPRTEIHRDAFLVAQNVASPYDAVPGLGSYYGNRILFQNRAARLTKGQRKSLEGGLVDSSIGGIFRHEFGHAVDFTHGTAPRHETVPHFDMELLSKYSTRNLGEGFAELFSAVQGHHWKGASFRRDVMPFLEKLSTLEMAGRHMASGGEVGPYIVNENGRELFVPKRLEHVIPPDVMRQIPHRKDGGIAEIDQQPWSLFNPPEDGWIIPNHLKNKVPRADRGAHAHPHKDRTGRWVDERGYVKTPTSWTDVPARSLPGYFADRFRSSTPGSLREDVFGTGANSLGGRVRNAFGPSHQNQPVQVEVAGVTTRVADQLAPEIPEPSFATTRPAPVTIVDRAGAPLRTFDANADMAAAESLTRANEFQKRLAAARPRGVLPGALEEQTNRLLAPNDTRASASTFLGARVLFAFGGGRERAQARVNLAESDAIIKSWSTSLRKEVGYTVDPLEHMVGKLQDVRGEVENSIRTTGKQSATTKAWTQTLTATEREVAELDAAYRQRQEALRTLEKPASGLRGLVALQGSFLAYQFAIEGVSKAIDIGAKTMTPMINRLTGFSMVAADTTKALADSAQQLGGDVAAAIAGAAPGVGGTGQRYLQGALGAGINARAGADIAMGALGLFQSALAYQTGAAAPGIYQGQGGLFGGPILAEQLGGTPGLATILSRGVGDYQSALGMAMNPTVGGRLGQGLEAQTGVSKGVWDQVIGFGTDLLKGMGVPGADVLTREQAQTPQDIERARAAQQGLAEWTNTWNDAAERSVDVAGRATTGLKLMTAAQAGVSEEAYKNADAFAKFGDYAHGTGLVLVDANKQVTTNFDAAQKTLANAAAGFQIESKEAFAFQARKQRAAAIQLSAAQGELERNLFTPYEFAASTAQAPPVPGMFAAQISGAEGRFFGEGGGEFLARIQGGLAKVQTQADARLEQSRADILDMASKISEVISPEAASTFESAMLGTRGVLDLGQQIAERQLAITRAQSNLRFAEIANNLRLAGRSLADALGLAGRPGGSRLGELQRESTQLGFQLQQRDINLELAVAGFQVAGESPGERAARQDAAIARANVQQNLLDIARETFQITANRGVTDASATIRLLHQSQRVEEKVILNNARITELQQEQQRKMSVASSFVAQAGRNINEDLSLAGKYVAQFGDTLKEADEEIRSILGLAARNTTGQSDTKLRNIGDKATGVLFNTAGPTQLTVGEAGTETVGILRNPRVMDVPVSHGQGTGGISIVINIPQVVIREEGDIRRLAEAVEERISTRLQMVQR